FLGSNHGLATYGALSVSGYSAGTVMGFSPLVPEVTHIPYPYQYRWDGGGRGKSKKKKTEEGRGDGPGDRILDYLEEQVFRTVVPPSEVAGVFVEPIQGDGGVLVPPDGFLARLQEICARHGILFIADEVQTGFGRTGRMFASEHWGLDPDIVLLGKPLGGGTPVSACVARSDVMDWPHGSHVITGAGHPLGCAGALAMIGVLERERLWENASRVGSCLQDGFQEMKRAYDIVGDVRGMGLLVGVEIVRSKRSKAPGLDEIKKACALAFEDGLLTAYDGLYGNVFRITPALNMTEKLARVGLGIMDDALARVQREQTG
ncbi:MAG: aminotransferase class III-fold pyridoxal phosphate-dependent enzyme, partial [Nitrososphaerales archaeon]